MEILITSLISIGKILIALVVLTAFALTAWSVWAAFARANVKHDPIEYYRGWGGYSHPIGLDGKISKEEAEALHAEGRVYLIGHYNDGKLTRVAKLLKGAVFFDFEYTYYPNGRRKSVKTTNAKGVVKVREFDRWRRGRPENPSGFW